MEEFLNLIADNSALILLWSSFMTFIFFLFFIIVFVRLSKLKKKYNNLMNGSNANSIESLLLEHNKLFIDNLKKVDDLEEYYNTLAKRMEKCVQKVGVIRYNAFYDTGSDLSFSIAMLDEQNNGFVVSGIYGRNDSTTYAKPIIGGVSKYTLSAEEIEAINNAMSKNK